MRITTDDVVKVARLARLDLDPQAIGEFTTELASVLEYFQQLNAIPTEGVVPLAHTGEVSNVFAEDTVVPSISREAALGNAPARDERCFLVPPVIEKS